MIGIAMSIRITWGSRLTARCHGFGAVAGVTADLQAIVRRKDRLEGLAEQAMVVRDQDADPVWHGDGSLHDGPS